VTDRVLLIFFLMFVFHAIVSGALPDKDAVLIRIHDTCSVVDLRDILHGNNGRLSENDLKRICAEITDRYHDRGYTAFYIKRAVLNKDGTADLFFVESIVAGITVAGISQRRDDAAASIFKCCRS